MAASLNSPEDVVNAALARIGYKLRINNMYDGSMASKKALDIYSQTRDAVLRMYDWGFAERIAAGTLSGQAAPAPWADEYNYPVDCIRIRNIFFAGYLADKNNPLPTLYTVYNDPVAGKTILTQFASPTLVYTSQVTDPKQWEPLFGEKLIIAMGKRLAVGLVGTEAAKMEMAEETVITPEAEDAVG